jgi:nucleoside 2-deoxyribosyltransferase
LRIYLAGPLFTTAERDFNAAFADRLRAAGHDVWLPQDQELDAYNPDRIFRNDVDHIDWAEGVVGIMDGSDPDSGTAWEIGYAFAKGMPIVLLRTDFREWGGRTGDAPYNLMLTESATEHIELHAPTVDDAAGAVIEALSRVAAG